MEPWTLPWGMPWGMPLEWVLVGIWIVLLVACGGLFGWSLLRAKDAIPFDVR